MYAEDFEPPREAPDGKVHDAKRLTELQALPLDRKIMITQTRIIEYKMRLAQKDQGVFVSLSGGKDSTVLAHIAEQVYPGIKKVFSNTGLEYPEIQKFAASFPNTDVIRPKKRFDEVISTSGYPLIGKEVAEAIFYARNTARTKYVNATRDEPQGKRVIKCSSTPPQFENLEQHNVKNKLSFRQRCFTDQVPNRNSGKKSMFNKERWLPICRDLPVLISHKCCAYMKKAPLKSYEHTANAHPIIGTMAEESLLRKRSWLRAGCNAFDTERPTSQPLSFWTEQDVLQYIKKYNVPICSVYGEIVAVDADGNVYENDLLGAAKLKCTGCERTGCIYCAFGFHLEKGETRFQRLARTHPRQYEYCIGGGQWVPNPAYDPTVTKEPDAFGWVAWNPKQIWVPSKQGLGMGKVFDMCNEIYGKDFYRYE